MSKKKLFMSVTATAVIASSLVHAQEANASSYTVKQGDSLWSISQRYDATVAQLKSWNNLSSDLIRPNQIIKVANSGSKNTNSSSSSTNSSHGQTSSTYIVKKGDNLSTIAAAHGISLTNLMKWNNLDTTLIFPGDKLQVSKGTSSNGSSNSGNNNSSSSNSSSTNNARTYTVKSGDNLSNIAAAHGVSVSNLKSWNNLKSDLIHPGDRLAVSKNGANQSSGSSTNNSGNSSSNNSNSASNSPNTSAKTYTVKSGDNLSNIAAAHGISLNNLKQWNNITSHIIYPGDRLIVSQGGSSSSNGQASSPPSSSSSSSSSQINNLINKAKSALGVKYTWAGSSLSTGFDCSGFIYWAFKESGQNIGRYSTDGYYNRSFIVNKPEVGDLVFFENTYRRGISHMGIYLGNNQFIHAGSSTGVTIANVNNSYWQKHFHSFKRFY